MSNGGGAFVCGKGIKDPSAAAIGSVALAMHVRSVAKLYGVPVVLHSDHCAKVSIQHGGLLSLDRKMTSSLNRLIFFPSSLLGIQFQILYTLNNNEISF